MRFPLLSKIAIPLHLAFIFGYLACVQPGPDRIVSYLPLAFLAAGLLEVTLLFPSARKGEGVDDARGRVLHALLGDPVFHIGVVAFLFIVFQTLNGPRTLVFDKAARQWVCSPGFFRGFPACLDQMLSVQGLFWVLVTSVAVLAVRNGLGRNGRELAVDFVLGVAILAGLHGLYAYSQVPFADSAGNPLPPPASFGAFATGAEAGAFFFMTACAAFGALFTEFAAEEPSTFRIRYRFGALLTCVAATLFSLSCLSIVALLVAVVILAVYSAVYIIRESPGELSLSTLATILVLAGVVGFLHYVAYPQNRLHDCQAKIVSGPWLDEAEKAEGETLRACAWRMFKDNAVGGVGTWCYGIDAGLPRYVRDDEWETLRDPDAPHYRCGNDLAQLFAEFGALGTSLLLAPFVLIACAACAKVFLAARHGTSRKAGMRASTAAEIDRIGVFDILPPSVLSLFVAVAGATALSFFVSVFRCQLNILTWAVFLALATAQLPKPRKI